jgi:hypothetical protein
VDVSPGRAEEYGGPAIIVDFEYEYEPNTNNISEFAYVHRGDSNAVEFTYDGLDRLALVEYNVTDETNKAA